MKMLQFGLKTILAKKAAAAATRGEREATDNATHEAEENRGGDGAGEGKGNSTK